MTWIGSSFILYGTRRCLLRCPICWVWKWNDRAFRSSGPPYSVFAYRLLRLWIDPSLLALRMFRILTCACYSFGNTWSFHYSPGWNDSANFAASTFRISFPSAFTCYHSFELICDYAQINGFHCCLVLRGRQPLVVLSGFHYHYLARIHHGRDSFVARITDHHWLALESYWSMTFSICPSVGPSVEDCEKLDNFFHFASGQSSTRSYEYSHQSPGTFTTDFSTWAHYYQTCRCSTHAWPVH